MSSQSMQDRTHTLVNRVIDAIAEDDAFREALKADPEQALVAHGFQAEVDALLEESAEPEVQGFNVHGQPEIRAGMILGNMMGFGGRPGPRSGVIRDPATGE